MLDRFETSGSSFEHQTQKSPKICVTFLFFSKITAMRPDRTMRRWKVVNHLDRQRGSLDLTTRCAAVITSVCFRKGAMLTGTTPTRAWRMGIRSGRFIIW